ncbi:MAG: acyltransferase [Lachnospiraceae bacterium]|nr:acyltransferase [Lachnospiraceae bacterium]
MGGRAERKSGIELLRIFAACGVIVLHYNNGKIGGGFAVVEEGSLNEAIMTLFESLFICAVNLYVLISGYFMRDSMKRDLLKPVQLLAQFFIFESIFFLIKEIPHLTEQENIFKTLVSYYTPSYWFVFIYITLYIVSPYINFVWKKLDKKNKRILLYFVVGLFSILSIITDMFQYYYNDKVYGLSFINIYGSSEGYTIVNFVLMYLIGCYLKELEEEGRKYNSLKLFLLLVVNIFVIFGWIMLDRFITGNNIFATPAINYNNPLVITAAILLFLLFKNINIGSNKIINKLAEASFPAYLIHINLLEYCGIKDIVNGNTALLILHIIGSAIILYMISFAIFIVYDLITKPVFKSISGKWKKRRYINLNM